MAGTKKKIEASTQAYLPISEIKEGVVTMKDGSLRAVIIVSSLNFALKSDDEKTGIVISYQAFLNSLSFPVQIIASSRKLDLSNYLASIDAAAAQQTNNLIKLQTEEYKKFIQELLESSNIMEKRFFVVVPFYPSGINSVTDLPNPLKKNEVVIATDEHRKMLLQRVEEIINGLSSVGLRCVALGTEDLLQLYYSLYNPQTATNQPVNNVEDFNITLTQGNNLGG